MNRFTLLLVIFGFTCNSQISNNLLLHYTFDGSSNNLSGNGDNSTMFNGATFGNVRFSNPNSAAYLDGINDYINFPNISQLKPDLPVPFLFWKKYESESHTNQVVFNTSFQENRSSKICFNTLSLSNSYAINFGDGTNTYTPNTRRTFVSNSTVDVGIWQHIPTQL